MNDLSTLQLPSQYEPRWRDPDFSCVESAARLLHEGADEGTLVISPVDGPDADGNLDLALTLHPEIPAQRYGELAFVAAVSFGQSLAAVTSPMISLLYGWPNRILLNDLCIAHVTLTPVKTSEPRLVLGLQAYVARYPHDQADAGCVKLVDPESDATAEHLLALFTRHFLHWINTWDASGFDAVHRVWEQRLDKGYGDVMHFASAGTSHHGVIESLDSDGSLVLRTQSDTLQRLPLIEFFSTDSAI